MMVAGGYPGDYEKGKEITGLEKVSEATVFHAGTKQQSGKVVTNGGRVLAFTGMGDSIDAALQKSFGAARCVGFEGAYYRRDIGKDLMEWKGF